MTNTVLADWIALAVSILIVAAYELRLRVLGRRRPERIARTAHGQIRADWAMALGKQPGSEILAVQTLRNSLMSSTIVASTTALASMGTISLAEPTLALGAISADQFSVRSALMLLLLVVLFGSFVASALAMRYFSHAGYMMGFPVGSLEREAVTPVAVAYVRRAGHHYSWSLRLLLFVAPVVTGILSPLLMPFAAIGLILALRSFDMPRVIRLLPEIQQ